LHSLENGLLNGLVLETTPKVAITTNGLLSTSSSSSEDQIQRAAPPMQIGAPISPIPPVITDERFNLLWPQPKHMHQLSDDLNLFPNKMSVSVSPGKESIHK
jgi:hypothetical protein